MKKKERLKIRPKKKKKLIYIERETYVKIVKIAVDKLFIIVYKIGTFDFNVARRRKFRCYILN